MQASGSFYQFEHRIKFLDSKGDPIQGVRLEVYDVDGNKAFNYPVSDFSEDLECDSELSEEIVFHHVRMGVEFAWGYDYLIIPSGGVPVFDCRFFYRGREIYAIDYASLNSEGLKRTANRERTVKRMWTWPQNVPRNLPFHWQFSPGEKQDIEFVINEKTVRLE